MIIAVDGPAGSGKSTVSKMIADEIGITYLDTGAMYRLFAYKLMKEKIDFSDREKELKVLEDLNIDMKDNRFYLDNEDVTDKIRTREISSNASKISVVKEVREKMVELQRAFSKSKDVILDGRDIGTVVFPDADLKVYLNADAEIRAERRCEELRNKGENVEYEEILREITTRDYDDMHREESPLKIAQDAVILDSTSLSAEEVKDKIKELIEERTKKN
ncbi:(d)CMP kinase [Sebaldella sp. S0638]|uniref:(d)CMP kinase n=1 Tax=Sebaldella sp. S0638 TaxID=2957809 RepID=UPI0020A1B3A1|nr:(d)CMP kinase [Sebaldella sp. S0638]MCP1224483.1 (d)CMP kinase [Sebaldella sp. S0638]